MSDQVVYEAIAKLAELVQENTNLVKNVITEFSESATRFSEAAKYFTDAEIKNAETVELITQKYTQHIDQLAADRDRAMEDNERLVGIIERMQKSLEASENKPYEMFKALLDKVNIGQTTTKSDIHFAK